MENKQELIGLPQVRDYLGTLSRQLAVTAELYGLDIQETEELTRLVSTEMESPSPNISRALRTLMSGLKASNLIMSDSEAEKALIVASLQALPGVRYSAVLCRKEQPTKVRAYLGRE